MVNGLERTRTRTQTTQGSNFYLWLPADLSASDGDIRLALSRIVFGGREQLDRGGRVGDLLDHHREFLHRRKKMKILTKEQCKNENIDKEYVRGQQKKIRHSKNKIRKNNDNTTRKQNISYLHGVLVRVADVDGLGVIAVHQFDQPIHQVIHVLKGTCLLAVAVDGDVLVLQRLPATI